MVDESFITELSKDLAKKEEQVSTLTKEKVQVGKIHEKAIAVIQNKLDNYKKQFNKKIKEAINSRVTDETYFKIREVSKWYNPLSWVKPDKTNPIVMIIMSPAGDLTIRERVADQRGNLKIGKNVLYRIENTNIWDIADSDVTGFRGKRVLFYFQDIPNPISINRDDAKQQEDLTVTTETYSKSQKSHIISQLLTEDLTMKDYITMVLIGANLLFTLIVIVKLFFMK